MFNILGLATQYVCTCGARLAPGKGKGYLGHDRDCLVHRYRVQFKQIKDLLEKCHANDKKNIPLFGVFKENKLLGLFFDKDIAQAFCKENSPRKMKTKGIKEVSIKEWPSLASFVEACQFT